MVAEVVRLLGYTKNVRILTNPATEMLHSVALRGLHGARSGGYRVARHSLHSRYSGVSFELLNEHYAVGLVQVCHAGKRFPRLHRVAGDETSHTYTPSGPGLELRRGSELLKRNCNLDRPL